MEVLKKTIKQAVKIENDIIIPNSDVTHNLKILLSSKAIDLGVFDSYSGNSEQ